MKNIAIEKSKSMKKIITVFVTIFAAAFSLAAQNTNAKVALIFDSDIGPDYDDVGAMAVMHALADSGKVNILATMASNQSTYIASVLDVLNTYFKRPGIPVGVVKNHAVNLVAWQKWDSIIVSKYPHQIKSNEQAQDALSLYRQILAAQPDKSVTIVTVGFLTNMADLLQSSPDKYSALSGMDLIKQKVKHLVCMAGHFPQGKEFNVDRDPASSKIVFDNWPTQIIFSGWEIGSAIHTGLPLTQNETIQNSPVKDVFAKSIPMDKQDAAGRMSWDETAVLIAINGYENYFNITEGRFICMEDGSNKWNANGKGHFYVTQKMPVPEMENVLNKLMMHQPVKK